MKGTSKEKGETRKREGVFAFVLKENRWEENSTKVRQEEKSWELCPS